MLKVDRFGPSPGPSFGHHDGPMSEFQFFLINLIPPCSLRGHGIIYHLNRYQVRFRPSIMFIHFFEIKKMSRNC